MDVQTWTAVDAYIEESVGASDEALEAALDASTASGLPAISVTPAQGKLLNLLTRLHRVRNILEIGTLGGYSTIWLARALPTGGRLITLEADPKHAEVARANIARAGLGAVVEVRVGPALETLPALAGGEAAPFDLVFIDADKPNTAAYFAWALRLTRPGGLIITDNVVRNGAVADAASADPNVQGVRRFLEAQAAAPGVEATVLQTVGSKGYDGLAFALVTEPTPAGSPGP
jgi:predicted O-methyltransferase YrrM